MVTADNLDTARSIVLLVAAVIGLIAAVLALINSRLRDAETPEAKQGIYRSAIGWVEISLWCLWPIAAFLPFGATWTLCAWIPAYMLGVYLFLTSNNSRRLRADIFKLVFGAQSILFMVVMAVVQRFLALFESLLEALGGK